MPGDKSPFEQYKREALPILDEPVEILDDKMSERILAASRELDNFLAFLQENPEDYEEAGIYPSVEAARAAAVPVMEKMLKAVPEKQEVVTQLDLLLFASDEIMTTLCNEAILLAYSSGDEWQPGEDEAHTVEGIKADFAVLRDFHEQLEGLVTKGTLLRKRTLQGFLKLLDREIGTKDQTYQNIMDQASDVPALNEERIDDEARKFYWRLMLGKACAEGDLELDPIEQVRCYHESLYVERPPREETLKLNDYLPSDLFAVFLDRADDIRASQSEESDSLGINHSQRNFDLFSDIKNEVREYIPGIESVPGMTDEEHRSELAEKLGYDHNKLKKYASAEDDQTQQLKHARDVAEQLGAIWKYDLGRDNPLS